jgi:hypothetical protein
MLRRLPNAEVKFKNNKKFICNFYIIVYFLLSKHSCAGHEISLLLTLRSFFLGVYEVNMFFSFSLKDRFVFIIH